MKANETKLLKLLYGPKQFIVPIYQRSYNWEEKHCEQLWEDIIKAGKDNKILNHFLGSIVYVEEGIYQISSIPKLLLIDGQQRLTTISLLLAVVTKYLKNPIKGINEAKIKNYYLINKEEDGENRYKLVLTKNDKESLFKIIDGHDFMDDFSPRIKENYNFFERRISGENIEEVLVGLDKLIIIDVSLDKEKDNPQLIFESLNSTGLDLTQADLIRNFILMGLSKKEQDDLYNNYWKLIEKNFECDNQKLFDRFMRDYLTIKTGKIPNIKNVYSEFKSYSRRFNNVKKLVVDIYKYSNYFSNLVFGNEKDKELFSAFSDIKTLKVNVSYPFLMKVYGDYDQDKITKDELLEIVRYIESYVFRRAICGIPTNSLDKIFANLYKEMDQENYLESFKVVLILKDSYRRFPKDEEFKEEFIVKDIYNSKNKYYLLRKLENYDRKEMVDIKEYTIEHIMPQNENLSDEWKKELGENWEEIHNKYLHTIGNLTLTGYNPELSDRPFEEKKNMKGGFADSPIRLNRYLAKLDHWNEEEIINRAKELANLAIKIWPYPKIDREIIDKYRTRKNKKYRKYTIESDHPYIAKGGTMYSLLEELRKRILNIDSSIKEEILKLYIAYKTNTNFVDVIPLKSKLRLVLNMKFKEIRDPKNVCKDITNLGRWGNGDVQVDISKFDELDYIMYLIKQSFDNIAKRKK